MSKRSPPSSGRATSDARSRFVELREHRVGGVRVLFVRKVEPRHELLQEPAGEDGDDDVRRLRATVRGGHSPWLDRDELERAVVGRLRAAEPAEALLELDLRTIVDGMRVAAGGVRLPDLDHAVRHRIAVAVQEQAPDPDRARVVLGDEDGSDGRAGGPDREVRSHGLGRRQSWYLSHRVAPRAELPRDRRARCRSGSRATSRAL